MTLDSRLPEFSHNLNINLVNARPSEGAAKAPSLEDLLKQAKASSNVGGAVLSSTKTNDTVQGDINHRAIVTTSSSLGAKRNEKLNKQLENVQDRSIINQDKAANVESVKAVKFNQETIKDVHYFSVKNGKVEAKKLTDLDSSKAKKYSEDKSKFFGVKEGNKFRISPEVGQKLNIKQGDTLKIGDEELEIDFLSDEEAKELKGLINTYVTNKAAIEKEEKRNKTDPKDLSSKVRNGNLSDSSSVLDEKIYQKREWVNLSNFKTELAHRIAEERREIRDKFKDLLESIDKHKQIIKDYVKNYSIKTDGVNYSIGKEALLDTEIKNRTITDLTRAS